MPKRARSGEVSSPARVVAPDQRERLHRHFDRAGARALADDDVELEVLHRRIEDLFDRRRQAMDLVDEQHFARLQVRQDAGQIAGLLDHRPRRGARRHAELVGDDVGERRLAQARRAVEQHVIERLAALARRRNRDRQVLAHAILADVVVEPPRPEPRFVLRVVFDARRCRRADHSVTIRPARALSAMRGARPGRSPHQRSRGVCRAPCRWPVDGTRGSPAPTRDRRAGDRRRVGAGTVPADSSAFGRRSRISSTMRSAVFLPTPGMLVSRATSPR